MKIRFDPPCLTALAAVVLVADSVVAQESRESQESVALTEVSVPFVAPPVDVLTARRAELIDSIGIGVVLLKSSSLRNLETDYLQDSDFRQDNDFFFLTGIEVADSWLLLDVPREGNPSTTLFIPERNPAREQWTGPRPSLESAAAITGIEDVRVVDEFESAALAAISRAAEAGTPVYARLDEQFVSGATAEVSDIRPLVAQLRLIKDEFELRMLQRAIDITGAAQRAAMRSLRPGMYEYETEAVIDTTSGRAVPSGSASRASSARAPTRSCFIAIAAVGGWRRVTSS